MTNCKSMKMRLFFAISLGMSISQAAEINPTIGDGIGDISEEGIIIENSSESEMITEIVSKIQDQVNDEDKSKAEKLEAEKIRVKEILARRTHSSTKPYQNLNPDNLYWIGLDGRIVLTE